MFFYNVSEKELFNLLFHMTISPSINNLIYYFNLPHTSKAPKHQHLTLPTMFLLGTLHLCNIQICLVFNVISLKSVLVCKELLCSENLLSTPHHRCVNTHYAQSISIKRKRQCLWYLSSKFSSVEIEFKSLVFFFLVVQQLCQNKNR